MSELISFGGGVNSTAMTILLVNEGWRGPIVFADTGCEWPDTYHYMGMFECEWLAPRGLGIERLGGEWRENKRAQGMDLLGYCEHYAYVPLAGIRWCTRMYKADPMANWARAHGIDSQLIGIAADEAHRTRDMRYPLIERGITRQGCIDIIRTEGLDVPMKSGCYICPFQRTDMWRELYRRYPQLYERAARLEEIATERRNEVTHLRPGGDYTLRELQAIIEQQMPLFDDSELDDLLIYKPCLCEV